MTKNYAFANVRKGEALVVDPLQHIVRGGVCRDGSTWKAMVPSDDGFYRTVAVRLPSRAEAASFVIWYDSHSDCGCEWYDGAGNGREMYQVAS